MSGGEYLAVRTYWRWQHDYRRANPPWSRFYGRKFFRDPELAELTDSTRLIALGLVSLTAEYEKEVDPRDLVDDPEVHKTWTRLAHERSMTCRVGVLKVDPRWIARELNVNTREVNRALESLTAISFIYRGSWHTVASRNLADFTHAASKKLAPCEKDPASCAPPRGSATAEGKGREGKEVPLGQNRELSTETVPVPQPSDLETKPGEDHTPPPPENRNGTVTDGDGIDNLQTLDYHAQLRQLEQHAEETNT